MTESCGYSHVCRPGQQKIGWIGLPCPDVEVRIDPAGEVQVRSGATMLGYFKDPQKTAETLTEDGFLRTGDKGEQDAEGRAGQLSGCQHRESDRQRRDHPANIHDHRSQADAYWQSGQCGYKLFSRLVDRGRCVDRR